MTELKTKAQLREILGGLSRTTLWKIEKSDPDFPRPISVSPGRELYLKAEVDAYLRILAARRDNARAAGGRP